MEDNKEKLEELETFDKRKEQLEKKKLKKGYIKG